MKEDIKKITEQIQELFVNRKDVYATAFLNNKRMGYKKTNEIINNLLLEKHIQGKITIGVYQLKQNKVKWGCADFDKNTKEDFEGAKKLFNLAKKEGYNPLMELSGGGNYKCHIWFFGEDCEAKDMKLFIEDLCGRAEAKPHEIFPKQEKSDEKLPYGNLVKLPLAYHLASKKKSYFLNKKFEPIVALEDIKKVLQKHIKKKDNIPKIIIKEKPLKEYSSPEIKTKPTQYDKFFNFVLSNELPEGISKTTKIGKYEAGVNNNILKNLAIWFYQKGYTSKQLEKEIKPLYHERGWAFGDLKGWFKKAKKGDITKISLGELTEWSNNFLKEEEKKLLPTIPTSTTYTTYINNWGYINLEREILIEQIDKNNYIYNYKGKIGISKVGFIEEKDDKGKVIKSYWKLNVEGMPFILKNKKIKQPLYLTPSYKEALKFIKNGCKTKITKQLFNKIEQILLSLFDFRRKEDVKICSLFVLFSYVLPYFESSFYFGIDATKGAGKTTLLEILAILSRHGFLADVSPASIPRLKEKYDLSIFIDEIDDLRSKEDVEGLLRKGQRRGNKYVRLNKNSLEEEIYEAFGIYGYSFRSEVEDAFKQRSILIRTATNKDSRLSIINLAKQTFLKEVFNKIFFWYVTNFFNFEKSTTSRKKVTTSFIDDKNSEVVEVGQVAGVFTHEKKEMRDEFYLILTQDFSKEEQSLIKTLFGRNSEIAYLFIKTCKLLDIDLLVEIKEVIQQKQEDEEIPDNYYFDLMRDIFDEKIRINHNWTLQKGEFVGFKYFPKNAFFIEVVKKLKENNLQGIGTPKYNSFLKDVGFIDNYNIKNQKPKGSNSPIKSLIFSKDVLKKLGLEYEPSILQDKISYQKIK